MGKPKNPHGASPSALGYLYQCRYALLEGLRAGRTTPQLLISVERFDDVAFEANGEPTALIQTKHHINRNGDLSDASVDLWKAIAIWLDKLEEDIEAPFRMKFMLLTTALAPDKSAASPAEKVTGLIETTTPKSGCPPTLGGNCCCWTA